ncbi:MAG TPA: hypothetical protein VFX12_15275 [Vicinamibacterales bacterium]|nr:hypothetical protein [Vicinamibacterales bacterium]
MVRIFRAFAWLRWRVLVNSLERTSARDRLERLSVATEKLAPLLTLILLVPSCVGVAVLGFAAGYGRATGAWVLPAELLRYLLLLATAMAVFGPIVLPSHEGDNAVRLLLLPISRGLLYTSQLTGNFVDPWVLLPLPIVVMVPAGLAAGGRVGTAAIALAAGILLVVLLAALTSLTASVIHLLLRNRRRGDMVMLLIVLVLPLVGLMPIMLHEGARPAARTVPTVTLPRPGTAPAWSTSAARLAPSELYTRAMTPAARRRVPLGLLAWLSLITAGVIALGYAAFGRLLDMPASVGARRGGRLGGVWGRTLPLIGPAASAVAFTQFRLALRTPRGRSILAGPVLMFSVFSLMMYRSGVMRLGRFTLANGLGLATFGCFICLFAILPLAANQFAIDRAGFTRQMLAPISVGQLLAGKAVGNALVAATPAVCCYALAGLLFRGSQPALWAALPIALVATYLLMAPAAAALSALFPRAVDLNSIGHASNAHQAAALLALVAFIASAVPPALLTLLALSVLKRPAIAPLLLLGWCGVAYLASRALFVPVRRLVARRCEALAQYY